MRKTRLTRVGKKAIGEAARKRWAAYRKAVKRGDLRTARKLSGRRNVRKRA